MSHPPLLNPRSGWGLLAMGTIALCCYAALQQDLVNLGGLPQLQRFLVASVHPDLSSDFLKLVFRASLVTFAYAVCGTFLSVLLGTIGGILASEVWWSAVLSRPARRQGQKPYNQQPWHRQIWVGIRVGLAVPRAIHELIWGLFFVNIFGLDPLAAILAIVIPYSAIVAKIFAEILDETPRLPLFALLNGGVAPLTAFAYSLIPQAFLNLLSYTFYRFECSIRSAAVLGIIGAGGLGYEILLSLQSLQYSQLWTLFFALVLLSGGVDWGSAWLRRRLGSPSRLDLNLPKKSLPTVAEEPVAEEYAAEEYAAGEPAPEERPGSPPPDIAPQPLRDIAPQPLRDRLLLLLGLGVLVLLPICFAFVGADFSKLWSPRTAVLLTEIGRSAFPPNWSEMPQTVTLSLQTLAMSILAITIATVGGVVLSFPAAHNFFLPGGLLLPTGQSFGGRVISWGLFLLTRTVLLIARAIPAPIWALVALFVLFPGILPGAIALGLHNLGILGRLMAEVIENLDLRPLTALKAIGATPASMFFYGVLPLSATRFLSYGLYRWEVCMRETVIVGLVGAGGLGRSLTEQLSSFDYGSVVVSLGCFVVLTFAVDWLSQTARRSLR